MATMEWRGKATAVAQIVNVTAGGTLAGETFTISVGGVAIASHTDTTTDPDDTKTALITAWNASTHVYATGITAAAGGTGIVTLTADTPGVPFAVTLNTPGGSATLGQSTITANAGPNDVSTADNYSGGAKPVNADTLLVRQGSPAMLWNLDDLTGVTVAELDIAHAAGQIGLESDRFHVDATTTDTTVREYRETWLKLGATTLTVGRNYSLTGTSATGSSRIKLDTESASCAAEVLNSAAQSADNAHPPIQLKFNHASAVLDQYGGSVEVADNEIADTSQLSEINQYGSWAKMVVGSGATVATHKLRNGARGVLKNTPTTLDCDDTSSYETG